MRPQASRRRLLMMMMATALALAPVIARAQDKDERPADKVPGLKSRVFEIKHRDTHELANAVRALGSGVKGTQLSPSREFKTLVVRDFPENIASIEDAIKRLDAPSPQKNDIEVRMRVLFAAPSGPGQYPVDLEGVVKQLQATLNYKAYFEIANVLQRVKDGSGTASKGVANLKPPVTTESTSAQYGYGLEDVRLVTPSSGGPPRVQIRKVTFWVNGKSLGEADLSTGLSLREGEKVVVGTANLKHRAMILVLSARVLK